MHSRGNLIRTQDEGVSYFFDPGNNLVMPKGGTETWEKTSEPFRETVVIDTVSHAAERDAASNTTYPGSLGWLQQLEAQKVRAFMNPTRLVGWSIGCKEVLFSRPTQVPGCTAEYD